MSVNPLPKGNQYRWAWRLFGVGQQYKRTPLPPKPYNDKKDGWLSISEKGYESHISEVDPERPHWRDPKFESRHKTPFFDAFGFNRNWSYTLWKFSFLALVMLFMKESQSMFVLQEHALAVGAKTPTPDPEWARDDSATEKELKAAGFALVGFKKLDNVGAREEEQQTSKR